MNGKERQDQVKAIRVAAQKDEIVVVAQGRKWGSQEARTAVLLSRFCHFVLKALVASCLQQAMGD